MKKFFGLVILVILLVAASGCTQPAKTPTATPVATPVPTTVVTTAAPTAEATMPPATVAETAAPTAAVTAETTAAPAANVTAEITVAATTKVTPKVSQTPSTKVTTIYIRNNTFVPKELTVLPGTGLMWVNDDIAMHQVKTLPTTTIKFTSADLVKGATFTYTFGEKEGEFAYYDTYTNATGVIIVKQGDAYVGMPKTTSSTPAPVTTTP